LHDSHESYFAALTVGWLPPERRQAPILQILGLQFLRMLIRGNTLARGTFARWRRELLRAHPAVSRFGNVDINRAAASALKALHKDLEAHPCRAVDFGLAPEPSPPNRSQGPEEVFNARLRARRSQQERHASDLERAGAAGKGAASSEDVRRSGGQLLAGLGDGDPTSITDHVAVIGNLSEQLALTMLVQLGPRPPQKALAWLDLPGECLCSRLDKVLSKGRRRSVGMEGQYLPTSQIVRRRTHPAVVEQLRRAAALREGLEEPWIPLGELLRATPMGRHHAVDGARIGGTTTRKLQRGLAAHLISQGHHRWLVALVLSQPVLVPPAREYYSACRSQDIDRVNAALHRALDMPAPPALPEEEWVGSFVAVSDRLVQAVVRVLARAADRAGDWASVHGLTQVVNRHAEYLALLAAVCLALREWVVYELSPHALAHALEISLCDKSVHEDPEAPVPVAALLADACRRWLTLLSQVRHALMQIGTEEAHRLADLLREEAERRDEKSRIVTVGADGRLHPVGSKTWRQRLPSRLRVDENFARHFWPRVSIEEGVPQRLLDVLLRQQLKNLHAGTANRDGIAEADREVLSSAIARVLSRLNLEVPRALGGLEP
jgi:hypothetical protein